MSCNTLTSLLSPIPRPPTLVLSPLLSLLNRYTSGLSLPVVMDELSNVLSTTHVSPSRPIGWATVESVFDETRMCILASSQGRVAMFLHSKFDACQVETGTVLYIPSIPSRNDDITQIVGVFMQRNKRRKVGESPTDIGYAGVEEETDPLNNVSKLILPTPVVLFSLPKLDTSHKYCTLQKVWNNHLERPPLLLVYIVNVETSDHSLTLTVTDSLEQPNLPRVQVHIPSDHLPLAEALHVSHPILIHNCHVNPLSNTFEILFTPETVLFTTQKTPTAAPAAPVPPAPSLSTSIPTFDDITTSECPTAVYHRLLSDVIQEKNYLRFRANHVAVRVVGRYRNIRLGDELVLRNLRYRDGVDSGYSQLAGYWEAEFLDNLSTLTAVLYAPFARCLRTVSQILRVKHCVEQWKSAHINVIVRNVRCEKGVLTLTVSDAKTLTDLAKVPRIDVVVTEACYRQFGIDKLSHVIHPILLKRLRKHAWMLTIVLKPGKNVTPAVRACVKGYVEAPHSLKK